MIKKENLVKYFVLLPIALYSFFYVIVAIVAPIAAHYKFFNLADSCYLYLMPVCHQFATRSFWLFDYPLALCCRCLGMYLGIFISLLFLILPKIKIQKRYVFSFLFLGLFEKFAEVYFYTGSNNIRFFAGIFLGLGIVFVSNICLLYLFNFLRKVLSMKFFQKGLSLFLCFCFATIHLNLAAISKTDYSLSDFYEQHKGKEVVVTYDYGNNLDNKLAISSNGNMLPAGTPVILSLMNTLNSSGVYTGDRVLFNVVQDVKLNGRTIIKAGSKASAVISFTEERRYLGLPGEIIVSDFGIRTVNGNFVPLQATLRRKGKSKMGWSVGLGLFICVLFGLMKGKDAIIPAGTQKTVYTAMDVNL